MIRNIFGSFLLVASCLLADTTERLPHKTPEEIQAELDQAERDFKNAQSLFNPWYSGPIVAGSATMIAPGQMNLQPYLYAIDNFGFYNAESDAVHNPHPLWEFQLQPIFQSGITPWMDISIAPLLTSNLKQGQSFTGLADFPLVVGFKIMREGVWAPALKFAIGETFPIGKYQHLGAGKLGTDVTGGGSWVTSLSFRIGKVLFWWTQHPLNTRLFLGYNIPTTVRVRGLNGYGGGFGTDGKVRPGNSLTADLGLELSLTQRWVLATDVIYTVTGRTKFTGNPGIDPVTGITAAVGNGSSYSFQLAPGIEYNWSDSLAAIGGIWFTTYGRNSGRFINYNFSVTWTYPP